MPRLPPWGWEIATEGVQLVILLVVILWRRRRDRDQDIEELHGRVDLVAARLGPELRGVVPPTPAPRGWEPPAGATTTGPLMKPTRAFRSAELEAARAEAERLAAESDAHRALDDDS